MKSTKYAFSKLSAAGAAFCVMVWVALSALTGAASADPMPMAPPVASAVSQSSVFNWQEVPVNQDVPITSAVFDQNGYQLYDSAGETIVVPFTNDNLYVMEFGMSQTGAMYFVNGGNAPILYVPRHGYLENATVSGGRWYPFSAAFQPAQPVYLGIAPSWSMFISMGWYSGMHCHGGYWCGTSGGVFVASAGLFFNIGGTHYNGWSGYNGYVSGHNPAYHIGSFHRKVYNWAGKPPASGRSFTGAGTGQSHPGNVSSGTTHTGSTTGRTFRGATGSAGNSGGRAFSGSGTHSSGTSGRSFGGGQSSGGGGQSPGGGGQSPGGGGHSSGGGGHSSGGGGHASGGGNSGEHR